MPDYDIQAVGLATPPVAAPVASYRPAVLVRNNGIHPATVTGYLRIYRREPPGELLETHNLALSNLAAGAQGNAQSSGFWTPTQADIGREYLFTAHVDTDNDQNPTNNDLSPVTIIVTAAAPPPPPAVLPHAPQHENGGQDELELDDLRGTLADPQTPTAHSATHEIAGADVLDVTGLSGVLAQGQPIADHHSTHENGQGDQVYVGGLHGVLADNQPSIVHDNAKHNPNYATTTELSNHLIDTTAVHSVAANLEQTGYKGMPNGYAPLDVNSLVPTAFLPPTEPTAHHDSHANGGGDEISLAGLSGVAADAQKVNTLQTAGTPVIFSGDDGQREILHLSTPRAYYLRNGAAFRLTAYGDLIVGADLPYQALLLRAQLGEIEYLAMSIPVTFGNANEILITLDLFVFSGGNYMNGICTVIMGQGNNETLIRRFSADASLAMAPDPVNLTLFGEITDSDRHTRIEIWVSNAHALTNLA